MQYCWLLKKQKRFPSFEESRNVMKWTCCLLLCYGIYTVTVQARQSFCGRICGHVSGHISGYKWVPKRNFSEWGVWSSFRFAFRFAFRFVDFYRILFRENSYPTLNESETESETTKPKLLHTPFWMCVFKSGIVHLCKWEGLLLDQIASLTDDNCNIYKLQIWNNILCYGDLILSISLRLSYLKP